MEELHKLDERLHSRPIGVFDSGVGGITVLKEAKRLLPGENFIYYADTANVPYGIKSREQVKKLVSSAVSFLAGKGVKAIVLACNTATSAAASYLRRIHDIPVIGMEPALKPAVTSNGAGKKVLVIATPLTLAEDKFKNLIRTLNAGSVVDMIPAPKLVEYAECGQTNTEEVSQFIDRMLSSLDISRYGTVVLGCTHFIYFRRQIIEKLPEAIDVTDGNSGTVKHLKNILGRDSVPGSSGSGKVSFFVSGNRPASAREQERFLKFLRLAP